MQLEICINMRDDYIITSLYYINNITKKGAKVENLFSNSVSVSQPSPPISQFYFPEMRLYVLKGNRHAQLFNII